MINERIDSIPSDPQATRWRRAARQHQNDWRDRHGWPAGTQSLPGGGERAIGSRIDETFAGWTGANFLSDNIREAVAHRAMNPQRHQTFAERRLRCDLLSSMPMCFNLFGDLWGQPQLAAKACHAWFPDICPAEADVRVEFEWSPGRADPHWLDDRTAFDAVFHIDCETGRRLVGVETKYHEYPTVEPLARRRRDGVLGPAREMKPRYREVTETAHLFKSSSWEHQIWGTRAEQVWRDHLLALACAQNQDGWQQAKYVLVSPAANKVWTDLSSDYAELLSVAALPTFEHRTIESLLAVGPAGSTNTNFRDRYLGVH